MLPTAYNSDYPHPLTAYASPGVNSATVAASGYAPRLRDLQESDPRATMGGILSDCGMSAPALSLSQGSKDGCGIPEKLWLQLSAWPGVKVPIGAVLPAALAARGASPRFLQSNNCPVSPTRTGSFGVTSTLTCRHKIPSSPVSPISSTFTQSRRLASSRSEADLQKMVLDKVVDNFDAPRASRASPSYERRGVSVDIGLCTHADQHRVSTGSASEPRIKARRSPGLPTPRRAFTSADELQLTSTRAPFGR